MAERRMFTNKITESDAFLEMPLSAQCLYFHLNMYADDDGFVSNPKKISRLIGANEDDLKLLVAKSFLISFEEGVMVIKHWRMHNLLRKDRYHSTSYTEEKKMLFIKENGAYTLDESKGKIPLSTTWQPNGNQMATEDRIGKDRIGKYKDITSTNQNLYDDIIGIYNRVCLSLPKVNVLSNKRKKLIEKVFLKDKAIKVEDFECLCKKVESSDFLTGKNGSWRATFDWVMNSTNIAKVLDGNYENHSTKSSKNQFNDMIHTDYDFDAIERGLLNGKNEQG